MKEAEVYELQLGMVQAKQRCETLEAETAKLDQWKDQATSQIADLERQTAEGCEQVRLGEQGGGGGGGLPKNKPR